MFSSNTCILFINISDNLNSVKAIQIVLLNNIVIFSLVSINIQILLAQFIRVVSKIQSIDIIISVDYGFGIECITINILLLCYR